MKHRWGFDRYKRVFVTVGDPWDIEQITLSSWHYPALNASVIKGAASTVFNPFGMERRDLNPRPTAPEAGPSTT